jgi:hypothetical protein
MAVNRASHLLIVGLLGGLSATAAAQSRESPPNSVVAMLLVVPAAFARFA